MESTHSFNCSDEFALRCLENIISSVSSVADEMRRGAKSRKLSQLLGRADSSQGRE